MEYLVTSNEMRAYDTYTIESIGIPSLVLMERAALQTVVRVREAMKSLDACTDFKDGIPHKDFSVLCVCGTGNNGGDGLCVTRLLREQGIEADAVIIGNRDKVSKETAVQLSVLGKYGVIVKNAITDNNYDIIVDALFGIGLTRDICGEYSEAIERINQSAAYKISVDIPSGIDADTGKVWGCAVKADETVAIAYKKRGHFLYPGVTYCGQVTVAPIGITDVSFAGNPPEMYTYTEPVRTLLPERKPDGNKGTFGKVLLVAGSAQMAGAALLCAESIYRTGAGMVKLVIPESIREIIQTRLPEALIQTYSSCDGLNSEEEDSFLQNSNWADVIAIGPGLGFSESAKQLLGYAVSVPKPLVIDADGLNMLAAEQSESSLWSSLKNRVSPTILTPHMGELARLLGLTTKEVVTNETKATVALAKKTKCIVVGKSARTHVCGENNKIFLNTAGNDKMATAGSGDVLTGMITALLARGLDAKNAAALGVYLHACAGDFAAKEAGVLGITASDIIDGLKRLYEQK